MLVKLASLGIHLVNDIHFAVPVVKVGSIVDEHVQMVTVLAVASKDVAISVVHLLLPLLAVNLATTHGAFRVLNHEVVTAKADMSLLVVAFLLLCIGRLSIGLLFGTLQTSCKATVIGRNLME